MFYIYYIYSIISYVYYVIYIILTFVNYYKSAFLFLNIIQVFQLSKLLDALCSVSDITLNNKYFTYYDIYPVTIHLRNTPYISTTCLSLNNYRNMQ